MSLSDLLYIYEICLRFVIQSTKFLDVLNILNYQI